MAADIEVLKQLNGKKGMSILERTQLISKLSASTQERLSYGTQPGFLNFFKTEQEMERKNPDDEIRARWGSSTSFVIGAIGSAVGLGNFWRFPYLTYKHGGVQFFLPYIMSVVFVGIPLLIMELGLGQKFGRGANIVYRAINSRIAGIGFS